MEVQQAVVSGVSLQVKQSVVSEVEHAVVSEVEQAVPLEVDSEAGSRFRRRLGGRLGG